jgi:hypothetical protein
MLFQRGEFLPLAKGGKEGFLKRIVGIITRPFRFSIADWERGIENPKSKIENR